MVIEHEEVERRYRPSRVLRSSSQPEGFDHLQANKLLLFTLRLFLLMTFRGGLGPKKYPVYKARCSCMGLVIKDLEDGETSRGCKFSGEDGTSHL